jgi:hypothetical protein
VIDRNHQRAHLRGKTGFLINVTSSKEFTSAAIFLYPGLTDPDSVPADVQEHQDFLCAELLFPDMEGGITLLDTSLLGEVESFVERMKRRLTEEGKPKTEITASVKRTRQAPAIGYRSVPVTIRKTVDQMKTVFTWIKNNTTGGYIR